MQGSMLSTIVPLLSSLVMSIVDVILWVAWSKRKLLPIMLTAIIIAITAVIAFSGFIIEVSYRR